MWVGPPVLPRRCRVLGGGYSEGGAGMAPGARRPIRDAAGSSDAPFPVGAGGCTSNGRTGATLTMVLRMCGPPTGPRWPSCSPTRRLSPVPACSRGRARLGGRLDEAAVSRCGDPAVNVALRFMSGNRHKILEVERILGPAGVSVVPVDRKIDEIQTHDVQALVRDKTLRAFAEIGRPLFVEHTGLELEGLNGLPGGLTQVFWDSLEADRLVRLASGLSSRKVIARTTVGFCDGRRLRTFNGEIAGTIAKSPRGPRAFQWDCVFVPDGHRQTFAQMGERKDGISMRRKALDALVRHLEGERAWMS